MPPSVPFSMHTYRIPLGYPNFFLYLSGIVKLRTDYSFSGSEIGIRGHTLIVYMVRR